MSKRTFTQDEIFDTNRVQVKVRGKVDWYEYTQVNFTNGVVKSVILIDKNFDLVEVPASRVQNFGWA